MSQGQGRSAAKLESALTETLDVIIIDYQPALTLFQLNNVMASTSLIIPQTMKGFDIATLSTFVTGLLGMLQPYSRPWTDRNRNCVPTCCCRRSSNDPMRN